MSVEAVKSFLAPLGKEVIELAQSSATVELAAAALKVRPERIAKTLSFAVDDTVVFKDYFHCKAKMLTAEEVLSATGHAVGGVCPFALPNPTPRVYLDMSLRRFNTVFPACGSSNSAIELSPDELYKFSSAISWLDICRQA